MVRQDAVATESPKPMVGSRINGEAVRHRNTGMGGLTQAMKMPTPAHAADDREAFGDQLNDMFGDSSDEDAPTGPPEPEEEDVRLSFTRVISVPSSISVISCLLTCYVRFAGRPEDEKNPQRAPTQIRDRIRWSVHEVAQEWQVPRVDG